MDDANVVHMHFYNCKEKWNKKVVGKWMELEVLILREESRPGKMPHALSSMWVTNL